MSKDGIAWPPCMSFVAVKMPSGLKSFLFGGELKVMSISGGNFQFSNHPALASIDVKDAATKVTNTSHEWDITNLQTLDGFTYDPRNPGCSAHAQREGGLLGAKIEVHSEVEVSLTTQLDESPMHIQFISKDDAIRFTEIVALTAVCCQQKFNTTLEAASKSAVDESNKKEGI
jgi:hypothetical protein